MEADESYENAKSHSLKLLARRFLSQEHVRYKLMRAGFSDDVIAVTLGYLTDYGYLDDARLIGTLEDRAIAEARGPLWLEKMLREHKLEGTRAAQATASIAARAEELAVEALQKRYPTSIQQADIRRAHQLLARRGFLPETIESTLSQALDEG